MKAPPDSPPEIRIFAASSFGLKALQAPWDPSRVVTFCVWMTLSWSSNCLMVTGFSSETVVFTKQSSTRVMWAKDFSEARRLRERLHRTGHADAEP